MNHVFVWTVNDVIDAIVIAVFLLLFAGVQVLMWLDKRSKKTMTSRLTAVTPERAREIQEGWVPRFVFPDMPFKLVPTGLTDVGTVAFTCVDVEPSPPSVTLTRLSGTFYGARGLRHG